MTVPTGQGESLMLANATLCFVHGSIIITVFAQLPRLHVKCQHQYRETNPSRDIVVDDSGHTSGTGYAMV